VDLILNQEDSFNLLFLLNYFLFVADFSITMKYLVFVVIIMVVINGITAAPFADSKAVCSPWLGYVSIIESKDNYSV